MSNKNYSIAYIYCTQHTKLNPSTFKLTNIIFETFKKDNLKLLTISNQENNSKQYNIYLCIELTITTSRRLYTFWSMSPLQLTAASIGLDKDSSVKQIQFIQCLPLIEIHVIICVNASWITFNNFMTTRLKLVCSCNEWQYCLPSIL